MRAVARLVLGCLATALTGCAAPVFNGDRWRLSGQNTDGGAEIVCVYRTQTYNIEGELIEGGHACYANVLHGRISSYDYFPGIVIPDGCRLVAEYQDASGETVGTNARCSKSTQARQFIDRNLHKWLETRDDAG